MKANWILTGAMACFLATGAFAQTQKGAITPDVLKQLRKSNQETTQTEALRNAITNNSIKDLALDYSNRGKIDDYFKYKVTTKGITNQKSSGRCWLFASLNVFRPKVIEKYNLSDFYFSQNYNFFFDQLEKANLFLEGIIKTSNKAIDDREVEWLFTNAIGDGGVWNGFVNIVEKYGAVPSTVMPENHSSENTSMISKLVRRKLREDGIVLRKMHTDGIKSKKIAQAKVEMLADIYHMLSVSLGEPPTEFTYRFEDKDNKVSEIKSYTPQSFWKEAIGVDLHDYVLLMNDPSRPLNKLYEIEYDRNAVEGMNWLYINLTADEIKAFAKKSIIDNEAMYFSCDVGKQLEGDGGTLDVNNYDYGSLLGVEFGMDKKARVESHESGSSHGMCLVGIDVDENENITKWLIENSWGTKGHNGHLIMTDKWFDEFMFRVVVNKKYVSPEVLKILETKPIMLPPWDPMYAPVQ